MNLSKKIAAIILLATLVIGTVLGSLVAGGYLTSNEADTISSIEKTVVADIQTAVPLVETITATEE